MNLNELGLYTFGNPSAPFRFARVLLVSDSLVFTRPFVKPPLLRWSDPDGGLPDPELYEPDPNPVRILAVAREEFESWIPHLTVTTQTIPEWDELKAAVIEAIPYITPTFLAQLERIEPSQSWDLENRICRVRLRSGELIDPVNVVEVGPYLQHWGPYSVFADDSISIEDVVEIEDSPSRIPPRLANKLYDAGESAMGAFIFSLHLADGRCLYRGTGGLVDVVPLPPDVTPGDIEDVTPHTSDPQDHADPTARDTIRVRVCAYRLPAERIRPIHPLELI